MDRELLAASAGYVRDSFVMAALDQLSEYEHLERILLDAVQSALIHYDVETLCNSISPSSDRYSKYQKEPTNLNHITSVKLEERRLSFPRQPAFSLFIHSVRANRGHRGSRPCQAGCTIKSVAC